MSSRTVKPNRKPPRMLQEPRTASEPANGTAGTPDAPCAILTRLSSLTPDPHNANRGTERGREMLEHSLRQYGAGRSIVVDRDGVVIGGNKTLEVAAAIGLDDVIVVPTDGRRLVVVQRTDLTLDDPAAKELAIADNRVSQVSLDFDPVVLQELAATGADLRKFWTEAELAALVASGEPKAGLTDPDAVPEERATDIEPGDLFALGAHRLLCGDSTKAEDVARVMDGDKALLMNTDPPYGIAYTDAARVAAERAHGRPQRAQKWSAEIENDGGEHLDGAKLQRFLEDAIRAAVPHLDAHAAFYLWHPMLTQGTFFAAAAAAANVLIHRQIIWVKPSLLFGFGDYHWRHELCFYGWRRGFRPEFYGERNQTTVWEITHETSNGGREHPTQKPVELFRRPIQNHCRADAVVYEPFCGSGSQLIAAEQLQASCRAIEIHPPYVQVALDRWEQFTGQKATKIR